MKKYLLFLGFLALSFSSQDSNPYKLNPNKFIENKISLSELADDIIYIPLDDSLLIGTTYKLEITKDCMYLSIRDVGILKFDRNGKLICKIGSIGRGPGEYTDFMDYAVDEKSGNVFVMGPGRIKVYSKSGTFLRDNSYQDYISFIGGDIEIYNSMIFIPDYLMLGDAKYSWIFLDTLGNLISKKQNSVPPFKTNISIEGSIYKYGKEIFYYNIFNDTIFSISPNLSNKVEYIFEKGNYRWPRGQVDTKTDSWNKIFKPIKMFETKLFIVFIYSYLDISAIALIDKKTKKSFLAYKNNTINNRSLTQPYLVNDYDGGMPLSKFINYYTENNIEYITQLISPFELKVHVSGDEFKKSLPKFLNKKKELENLANSLTETDNPILMMVRLKK